ncbi:hypothetical protein CSQ89_11735, partial [Chitinimonas sp. BJB300]
QPHSLLAPFVLFLPRQLASVFFVHFYQLGADTNKSTLSCRVNSRVNLCHSAICCNMSIQVMKHTHG